LRPNADERRVLWTEDLVRLDLPVLVFVSACSAGSAPPRAGDDGANRLDVTLIENGVDVAILSWEPIRLRAGLELAREFHEGRRRLALSPAAALHRARVASWEESGPAAQEPFLTHAVGVWRR
jgi:hypothetical protein